MKNQVLNNEMEWVNNIYIKIIDKESKVIRRSGNKIPYTTINGQFDDKFEKDPAWWTNGFWEGIIWLMYLETEDAYFKELANKLEERMDEALYGYEGLHHDVGFMWLLSSVANYKITGNKKSRIRGLIAANYLASRYNPNAGFITAWNDKEWKNWMIIDCMMNIPLLHWAEKESGDIRYKQAAINHADKTMKYAIRPDGSAAHITEFNLDDGAFVKTYGGQGYKENSSWTRGQAWALYGFIISYNHTKEKRYLDTAKIIANYFIAAAADNDYIPVIDFRSPEKPSYVDTTAGAIASCGLIEISKCLDENEGRIYLNAAVKILKAMEAKYADWSDDSDAILRNGSESYSGGIHMDIIYGDYYFIEAIFKLHGLEISLW